MATARYFIIDDYYFPIYVIKPKSEIIQLWHSSGAFKKFGLSTVGKPFGPSVDYLKHVHVHGNYSKVYVSSKEVVPYFAEAFGIERDKIKPLGVPRTDYFFRKEESVKNTLLHKYPDLKGKKLLLYAPTFRGGSHYQDTYQLPFKKELLSEKMNQEYALLIHLHPYMKSDYAYVDNRFIFNVNGFTIQELLVVADILITDYSTVFFDYSLLNKPIIFFAYDLDEYIRERDFYYDYKKLIPGPLVTDTESLITAIQSIDNSHYNIQDFANRFFDEQDGKASERIVRDIFNID